MNGRLLIACVLGVLSTPVGSYAQVDRAIAGGIAHLRNVAPQNRVRGEIALATMVLIKSGSKTEDPIVSQLLGRLGNSVVGGKYVPEKKSGHDNYEAAVVLMAFVAAGAAENYDQIEAVAFYLMGKQTASGAWDYDSGGSGDTSMTQYALLGLWEASSAGVDVPLQVWYRAMHWLITRQGVDGGFAYHPRPPQGQERVPQATSHTMSVAGAGSLILCRSQLPFRPMKRKGKKPVEEHEYLIPVEVEEDEARQRENKRLVNEQMADEAIALADQWMAARMTIDNPSGQSAFYYLYGLERYAALSEREQVGNVAWYDAGSRYLLSRQHASGGWTSGHYSDTVNSSFALLFLIRSTKKTMTRIRLSRLGQGTMLGGRGLPSADGLEVGAVLLRKPKYRNASETPVSKILAALTDPRTQLPTGAAVALEDASPEDILAATDGKVPQLCRLTRHDDPEVRRAAISALARTKAYSLAPILIRGLGDPELSVYQAARNGLRFLSRRADGFGLPVNPPRGEELQAGIERWRHWFDRLKVDVSPEQAFED